MPAAFSRGIIIITVDRTEVGLSPRDTDPNGAARLRIHGHGRAESHVLALHVASAGLFHARIVVSGGVHLAVALPEGAVPDDLAFAHSPGFAVGVGVTWESLGHGVRAFLRRLPAISELQCSGSY